MPIINNPNQPPRAEELFWNAPTEMLARIGFAEHLGILRGLDAAKEVRAILAREVGELRDQLRQEHMARVRAERRLQVAGRPHLYPWLHNG